MDRLLIIALAGLALQGCATSKATYLPDGRAGHLISCDGSGLSWGLCQEKAGSLCQARGYDIVSATGEGAPVATSFSSGSVAANTTTLRAQQSAFAYSGQMVHRSMLIACK